jgi:hypothetical protein
MNNFLVLIVLFAVASCGNSSDKNGNQTKSTDALNGPLSYSFVESGDRACETGRRSFETKEAMCMALQNQETNNSCAISDRVSKFDNECTGLGFRWIESAQCDLYVLKGNTTFPVFQESDVLAKRSVCAGRMKGLNWRYMSKATVEGALYKRTRYEISVEPRVDSTRNFDAMVSVTSPDGRVTFTQQFKTNLMHETGSELDSDMSEKIQVRCYIKDECEGSLF